MKKVMIFAVLAALLVVTGCNEKKEASKARAMGFDTLIMGMRDADALRNLFGIPEDETVMAVISLGYRAGEPNRPERRPLDDIAKFY